MKGTWERGRDLQRLKGGGALLSVKVKHAIEVSLSLQILENKVLE